MRGCYVTAVRLCGKRGGAAFVAAAPKLRYCIAAMLMLRRPSVPRPAQSVRHMTEILLAEAAPGDNLGTYSATSG